MTEKQKAIDEELKFSRVTLENFDPDLELKRLIEYCRKKGMSDEEILQRYRKV